MKLAALIFLSLLATSPVSADEATARAHAEHIVDLVGGAEVIQRSHAATLDRLEKQLISRGMPPEGAIEVRKVMGDWFTRNYQFQEIRSRAAAIYMQEFTEDELRQMIAFYETPVGQKALRKMAVLGEKVAAMVEKYVAERHEDGLREALKPILLKYGMTNSTNQSVQRTEAGRSHQDTNRASSPVGSQR